MAIDSTVKQMYYRQQQRSMDRIDERALKSLRYRPDEAMDSMDFLTKRVEFQHEDV